MTKILDLVPSEKILAARVDFLQRTQNPITESGLAIDASAINANIFNGGARKHSVPFMRPLATGVMNYSTDTAVNGATGKLTAGEVTALRHDANFGWEYFELSQMVTQFNIRGGIEAGLNEYWNAQIRRVAHNSMIGAAASDAGLRVDATGDNLNRALVIDATRSAGDAMGSFNLIFVSPDNAAYIQQDDRYFAQGSTERELPRWAGMRVIVSEQLTNTQTIIARTGALAVSSGVVNGTDGIKIQEDAASGNGGGREVLWTRRSFIANPQGVSYIAPHLNPTDAQLSAGASWELAVEAKHVGFRLITHADSYDVG